MSANGRLLPSELTVVQQGALPIALATVAAKQWFGMKSAYDSAHTDKLTIAAPIGGYRSYVTQEDMHLRPWLYGLSAYSTIPIAAAGYSTHGDGMAVDVADASTDNPRKRWLLANASKFGFIRQFGEADPNHYRLTSTPAGTGVEIPTVSITKETKMYIAKNSGDSSAASSRFVWGDGKTPTIISESTATIFVAAGVVESSMSRDQWLWLLQWARDRAVVASSGGGGTDLAPLESAVKGVSGQVAAVDAKVSAIPTTAASYNVQVTATPK